MNKTLLYLVILAVLGFGVYYFLFNNRQENPYSPAEAGFTVSDTASIGRIFLAANDGESVLLERTDSGWMVNKQYKVLQSTLSLLLTTLKQQVALYPVTSNAYDNTVKTMSTDGVKVEVYGRDGKKMKVFYVGGAAINNSGTNMLMEGATRPFVVQVQSFNGYLTARYTTRLRDWRDRIIFNFRPEEIKTVSMQYAANPEHSFTVTRDNGNPEVKSSERKPGSELNMNRVNQYLKFFQKVNCEGYLNGLAGMDSTIRTAPKHSSIDVEGMHGQLQHVDIYWMALNQRSKNITESKTGIPDDYDADRLYAVINNYKDTVMIQHFVFNNFFRKGLEFFQKDNPAPAQGAGH